MTWLVKPLQRRSPDGTPINFWHLCATSDEGGGFAVGCSHDHPSPESAQSCIEARKHIGEATGFPLQIDLITINGVPVDWVHDDPLPYEVICQRAGQPEHATVTYFAQLERDLTRSGILHKGKSVQTEEGMHIDCVVTGSA